MAKKNESTDRLLFYAKEMDQQARQVAALARMGGEDSVFYDNEERRLLELSANFSLLADRGIEKQRKTKKN